MVFDFADAMQIHSGAGCGFESELFVQQFP
jgi:hypothetical protein